MKDITGLTFGSGGKMINGKTTYWTKFCTASLDRIDSTKGYTENNVQWVHKDVNMMKQSKTDREFIKLCKEIVNYRCNDDKSNTNKTN